MIGDGWRMTSDFSLVFGDDMIGADDAEHEDDDGGDYDDDVDDDVGDEG